LASNQIGKMFVVTCFGESHGRCVGVVVDGCPAGLPLVEEDIQTMLDKRIPDNTEVVSARREPDKVEIFSGTFEGFTTGAPICALVWNKETNSSDYDAIRDKPRPGHVDYPAREKYMGFSDYRGGGRFSGRITAAYVIAGAIAKRLLDFCGIEILAYTTEIENVKLDATLSIDDVRSNTYDNSVRCPDPELAKQMEKAILDAKKDGDSVGGVVECVVFNLPVGVGEPVFDCIDADIAKILFDIPAVKGVEFGIGFEASKLRGSQNNDPYMMCDDEIDLLNNNSGGVLGGLSSGAPLVVRIAVKPTPSIGKEQQTVDLSTMQDTTISVKGRHDPCVVPKVVPVVEGCVSIVLVDQLIRGGFIPKVLGAEAVGEYCDDTEED
jgi:chorismate synthase